MATGGDDAIEIVRISGIFEADEAAAVKSLGQALRGHAGDISDPEARLKTRPLSQLEAAKQVDACGCVSGYRSVRFEDMFGKDEDAFQQFLAKKLTEMQLIGLEYEGVWTLGKVVVLYVKGVPTEDV